jgi:DNA-binding NarL/FixJ family response regulator
MQKAKDAGSLVLVVAPPGRLRDGLQAMLRSIPCVRSVERADDGPSALSRMEQHAPDVVLLDENLADEEAWTVSRQIRARWPHVRCLVLTISGWHQQQTHAEDADAVLVKGFTTERLGAAISRLAPEAD